MFFAFNLVLIAIVGLIAYWWANQGLFSAILHLACVIVAGAVAFAFWEPIAYGVLIRGWPLDDYVLGSSLVIIFAVTLAILRIVTDKIAPANVQMPQWANLSFGAVAGLASGTIAVGIFLIGAGFVQSQRELMGYVGWARSNQTGEVQQVNGLWVPFHTLTADFYGYLSVSSLRTARPLRHYNPDIDRQSSLIRDTYRKGRGGKLSLLPDAASVRALYVDATRTRYFVELDFTQKARDWGEQLTLAASQLRLIGQPAGDMGAPEVEFPDAFQQYSGRHLFDHSSHYVTSQGSDQDARAVIEFPVSADFTPRFIQVRNTRYVLPQARPVPAAILRGVQAAEGASTVEMDIGSTPIDSAVKVNNAIQIAISTNTMPASIKEQDRYLTTGTGEFRRGGIRPARKLRIEGIYEPSGSRCVKVNVSRNGPADIYRFGDEVDATTPISLVLARGVARSPVGYIMEDSDKTTIRLEPVALLRTIDDVPVLPTSGQIKLELLFYVNEGDTITGLRLGDIDVGFCNVAVNAR